MMGALRIFRHIVVGLAATLAIIAPLWFIGTTMGGKFGFWTPLESFAHVRSMAENLVIAALALGGAALLLAIAYRIAFGRANAPGVGGYVAGIACLIIGGSGVYLGQSLSATFNAVPPIHDISTDTVNPPQFSASMVQRRERDDARNSVDYASKTVPEFGDAHPQWAGRPLADVQREAFPEVQSIETGVTPDLAYEAALEVAREMGWRIATESQDALMFEGTDETFWFGFRDDVVVRVTDSDEGGAVVDLRSVSRVGASDLGANAARIVAFTEHLRSSLGES